MPRIRRRRRHRIAAPQRLPVDVEPEFGVLAGVELDGRRELHPEFPQLGRERRAGDDPRRRRHRLQHRAGPRVLAPMIANQEVRLRSRTAQQRPAFLAFTVRQRVRRRFAVVDLAVLDEVLAGGTITVAAPVLQFDAGAQRRIENRLAVGDVEYLTAGGKLYFVAHSLPIQWSRIATENTEGVMAPALLLAVANPSPLCVLGVLCGKKIKRDEFPSRRSSA